MDTGGIADTSGDPRRRHGGRLGGGDRRAGTPRVLQFCVGLRGRPSGPDVGVDPESSDRGRNGRPPCQRPISPCKRFWIPRSHRSGCSSSSPSVPVDGTRIVPPRVGLRRVRRQRSESGRVAWVLTHWTVMPSRRIIAMNPVMEKKIAMAVSPYVTSERSRTNERNDDETSNQKRAPRSASGRSPRGRRSG